MSEIDEIDEVIEKALDKAQTNPIMIDCPRCKGRGYHHGFGEDGHDPDWCEECGGGAFIEKPGHVAKAIRAALALQNYRIVKFTRRERPPLAQPSTAPVGE